MSRSTWNAPCLRPTGLECSEERQRCRQLVARSWTEIHGLIGCIWGFLKMEDPQSHAFNIGMVTTGLIETSKLTYELAN